LDLFELVLDAAPAVEEGVPVDVRVTPAKAQLSLAVLSAASRSAPVQLFAKHVDVELMNFWFVHRQWTSEARQGSYVALVKQPCAQSGYPGTLRGERMDVDTVEINPATKRIRKARIFGSGDKEGENVKRIKLGIWGRRGLGEISKAMIG